MQILFICTGNTCRSPLAEAAALARFGDAAIITSRGVQAFPSPASTHSIEAARQLWGVDISSHLAAQVSREDINTADIILTMTSTHKAFLDKLFPASSHKIHTLAGYCGEQSNISDPFGGSLEVYLSCAAQIGRYVDKMEVSL